MAPARKRQFFFCENKGVKLNCCFQEMKQNQLVALGQREFGVTSYWFGGLNRQGYSE